MTTPEPTILLVEDNEVNRDMLVRRLQRAGHEVATAADGETALTAMREQHRLLSGVPLPRPETVVNAFTAAHATARDGDAPGTPHEPFSVAILAQSIKVLHAYSACSVAATHRL